MVYRFVAISILMLLLSGCFSDAYYIRTTEYGGSAGLSNIIGDAGVGGCQVTTSQSHVVGDLKVTYTGDKCEVEYTTTK